jgi:hypothetical protein
MAGPWVTVRKAPLQNYVTGSGSYCRVSERLAPQDNLAAISSFTNLNFNEKQPAPVKKQNRVLIARQNGKEVLYRPR